MRVKNKTVILVISILCIAIGAGYMIGTYKTYTLKDFIANNKIKDLTLTITYLDLDTLTQWPLDKQGMLEVYSDECKKIIVEGTDLYVADENLSELASHIPEKTYKTSTPNISVHYKITSKFGFTVLDVALWSADGTMYINDVEYEHSNIYCEVLFPFIPEDFKDYLQRSMANESQRGHRLIVKKDQGTDPLS